jgi:hypothetical protein
MAWLILTHESVADRSKASRRYGAGDAEVMLELRVRILLLLIVGFLSTSSQLATLDSSLNLPTVRLRIGALCYGSRVLIDLISRPLAVVAALPVCICGPSYDIYHVLNKPTPQWWSTDSINLSFLLQLHDSPADRCHSLRLSGRVWARMMWEGFMVDLER